MIHSRSIVVVELYRTKVGLDVQDPQIYFHHPICNSITVTLIIVHPQHCKQLELPFNHQLYKAKLKRKHIHVMFSHSQEPNIFSSD